MEATNLLCDYLVFFVYLQYIIITLQADVVMTEFKRSKCSIFNWTATRLGINCSDKGMLYRTLTNWEMYNTTTAVALLKLPKKSRCYRIRGT